MSNLEKVIFKSIFHLNDNLVGLCVTLNVIKKFAMLQKTKKKKNQKQNKTKQWKAY